MLNMFKMDLCRMVRTKSMYVIWIILVAMLLFTTYLNASEWDSMQNYSSGEEQIAEIVSDDTVNIGMSVVLPTEPGGKVTVFDQIYSNMQAKFFALFMVLFAVLFSTADITSGYVKNIAGQVKDRSYLVISKALVLMVYTLITMFGITLVQAIANRMFYGYLVWGNTKDFVGYMGMQALLHYSLVLIIMSLAIILKNNVWSIVIAVCLCMNLSMVLYNGIDKLLHGMGIKDFQLSKYTVTGNIALLSMNPGDKGYGMAFVTGLIFLVVVSGICSYVFKKRDI